MDRPTGPNIEVYYLNGFTTENVKHTMGLLIYNADIENVLDTLEKNSCIRGIGEEGTVFNRTPEGWKITIFIVR